MNAANAVVFEGATADNNETTLTIIDPDADRTQRLINQSGYIPLLAAITTTAITSTPEEINILDDAVITTAELNILDGGTSASSTTVVDADRVILNDNGTMKQVAVTDLAAYFDDEITAMGNLVETGALNAGSITSGFGSIDVGSSAISTTGTLTYGTLNDGTTAMTSTVAELNLLDGGTSATSTTVVSADRLILNDNGTMKQISVTDLQTFTNAGSSNPNLTSVGALNSGSITSGFGAIDIGSSAFTTTGTGTVGTLVASSLFKMPDNTSTKFLVADGTSYQEVVMSGDATMANTGAITIANDAVENAMIAADAVTGSEIADDAINSEHYTDGSIDTAHIADLQVTNAKIGADAVTGAKIADDAINSEHYTDGSIDTAHIADLQVTNAKIAADAVTGAKIADDALNSEHYTDASVDFAHIQNLAANTVVVRDANSSGVASAKAVTNTQILIGDGTGFTAAALSGDATMTNAGVVTIAATAIEGSMLNNNVISGQTALASGIADTDELMISDAGTLKRVDASVFKTYLDAVSIDDATALAIALG
jgi:hypothetical protein